MLNQNLIKKVNQIKVSQIKSLQQNHLMKINQMDNKDQNLMESQTATDHHRSLRLPQTITDH